MELYKLRAVLREPSEDTEDKYLAEIPDLPGCRAWGDTPAQALESLQIDILPRLKAEDSGY